MAIHYCYTNPCPICTSAPRWLPGDVRYFPPPPTTFTYSWPAVDWNPGKGRHRKGPPEVGA